ncbi:hypothetical protein MNV_2190012 [Candidatus Methanoperedens nitroreducens]|uniref:Uncharacterized protein n=1 Tax=Candidatus Methanoperedens nitratireducens TaxID=1392998 RepID=A0A284VNY4_9EURY|nr:hypothetical protein MNV_2190012 [Candidatus Methanoperedens nitroreducens]
MKTTIAKKAINSGTMLVSREQASFLLHNTEAERISFKESNTISVTTPRVPSCGALIVDVAEIIPADELTTLDNIVLPPQILHYI